MCDWVDRVQENGRKYEWVISWMGEWIHGIMFGWMSERMGGCSDGLLNEFMDAWMDGLFDG
jgi:hypothetical protein